MKRIQFATIIFSILINIIIAAEAQAQKIMEIDPIPLLVDSMPTMSYMHQMLIVDNILYVNYSVQGGYGQQYVRSYKIDKKNRKLYDEGVYFRKPDGRMNFYLPQLFLDDKGKLLVTDAEISQVYRVNGKGLTLTNDRILSLSANVPHPIELMVSNVIYKSEHEYYFLGHQPHSLQTIYCSINRGDSLIIEEVKNTIYYSPNKSWLPNKANLLFNRRKNLMAVAYEYFPAIEIYNLNTKSVKRTTVNTPADFDPDLLNYADFDENCPTQFNCISSSKHNIFGLLWGINAIKMTDFEAQSIPATKICKIKWNGKLVSEYTLKIPLRAIAASADGKLLIGFNRKGFYLIDMP